jgi:FAD/FMN-containing dehydrogenase
MPFIDGETLRSKLSRETQLGIDEAVRIATLARSSTPSRPPATCSATTAISWTTRPTSCKGPQPYVSLQQSFDAAMPKGYRWYTRAHYLKEISDDAIDAVVEHTRELPGPFTAVYFGAEGGAVGRVDASATAFPHRDAGYLLHILPGWTDPAEDKAIMQWARDFHRAAASFATGGVYVNLMAEDRERGAEAAYGRNYERLAGLKREWDPDNIFRLNHNVRP